MDRLSSAIWPNYDPSLFLTFSLTFNIYVQPPIRKSMISIPSELFPDVYKRQAYGCMKPAAKHQLKRDMRNTAKDVESVKDEMLNVGQDVTDMAKNIKNKMM